VYHVLLFVAVLSIGVVAFVGVVSHTVAGRSNSHMPRYVTPSEIDLSVSNHFQGLRENKMAVSL